MTEQRTFSVLLLLHSESFKESEMFNLIGNNPTIFNLELPHVQEVYVFVCVLSIFIIYLLPHSPSSLPHYLPLKVIQSVLHTSKIIRFCKSFSILLTLQEQNLFWQLLSSHALWSSLFHFWILLFIIPILVFKKMDYLMYKMRVSLQRISLTPNSLLLPLEALKAR